MSSNPSVGAGLEIRRRHRAERHLGAAQQVLGAHVDVLDLRDDVGADDRETELAIGIVVAGHAGGTAGEAEVVEPRACRRARAPTIGSELLST